ncbi:MAG: hypothetical protein UT50_C0003G0019 [Candidatus Moranbacteria bacterium GW2011_GWA2_39_41]|nr:MAG: hypothetical protein UT50_C0003G0019 [Candidatus Moranbacteria bacterium GW2011_GWA2_39_41]
MTVYQNQNYSAQNDSKKYVEYDLESEKKRIAEGTEEIKKELLAKWQKAYAHAQIFPNSVVSMNPALIDFLLSFENTLFYNDLAKKFALNQQQRDDLPQIVWAICKNKNWLELETLLQNTLNIDSSQANQIASAVNNQILSKANILSTTNHAVSQNNAVNLKNAPITTENQTLANAIRIYPELGEQTITTARIKILNFPEPVRPSIKNWLADYTAVLGYDKHNSVARVNFLFHSENAKLLNSNDREKLSYILKAFDEKSMVTVDKVSKKIMFSESDVKVQPLENAQAPSRLNLETRNISKTPSLNNKISFSSPQKLAYERKDIPQDQPYRITPAPQTRPQPVENRPDPRALGKNVVNLREQ